MICWTTTRHMCTAGKQAVGIPVWVGHWATPAKCPVCPKAEIARRFMNARPSLCANSSRTPPSSPRGSAHPRLWRRRIVAVVAARPHPLPSCGSSGRHEDAPDDNAVLQHVVIVIAPLTGRARGRCAFEDEAGLPGIGHRSARWHQSQRGLCRHRSARLISMAPLSSVRGLRAQTDVLLCSSMQRTVPAPILLGLAPHRWRLRGFSC
jgi:hypothetical protein